MPKHAIKRGADKQRKTKETFIKQSTKIHGNLYNYNSVEYINHHTKVKIYCNKCKIIFEQRPGSHLQGKGCRTCKLSKGEKKIKEYLEKYNYKFTQQKKFKDLKDISYLSFDFYIKYNNKKYAIEYDGMQHFFPIDYFGGDEALKKNNKRDLIKTKYCIDNDIILIRISYNDYKEVDSILDLCFFIKYDIYLFLSDIHLYEEHLII